MSLPDEPLLQLYGITKIYPNQVMANDDINLNIRKETIHVILGENGAGKTTLMNILFGLIQPTTGEMIFKGKKACFQTTFESIQAGIGMIHQHFKLVPSLSVLENLFLGIEPKRFFFTNHREMKEILNTFLNKYDIRLPLEKKVEECSTATRQLIEIIKTLIRGADLIIMDEPTSLLAPQERDSLFNIIRRLKKDGKTIIFITHKLDEALSMGDEITIMRQGKVLNTLELRRTHPGSCSTNSIDSRKKDLKESDLIQMLFKGEHKNLEVEKRDIDEEVVLSFQGVNLNGKTKGSLCDVSFCLHKGEILGVAGLADSGQQEIIRIIMGYENEFTGLFEMNRKVIAHHTPYKARSMHVSYIPSDRLSMGSDGNLSLWENLISTQLDSDWVSGLLHLKKSKIQHYTRSLMQHFSIKAPSSSMKVGKLSGGNIQKTILARELTTKSQIILADNPTSGVDLESASFIRQQLLSQKKKGKAILLFSHDLDELKLLSDRIIVLYQGRINGEFHMDDDVDDYQLGKNMLGAKTGNLS